MTEMLNRITPEMSEEGVLGVILDEIMARAEPDVAEAIRFCAIPHWFNAEIIIWLRGEGLKPSQCSREILAALTELTFVGPYPEWGWAYHENVRDLLLRRWRERDSEAFKELSGRAAGYFEQKAEAAIDEERDVWERERMYHLLAADPEQGFDLFGSMFNKARDLYQLSTCALLLELAEEQEVHLSADDRLWLRFRQGQWERTIEYYERSLATMEKVGDEHEMAVTFNNLGNVYQVKGEWERAIEHYERSLAIMEKVGDEYLMSTTFSNLANVYQAKGEWGRAIEHHERGLAIMEKVGDEHGMAFSYNSIARLYQDQDRLEEAIPFFEKSLEIFERISDKPNADHVRGNLEKVKREIEAKTGQA